MTARAAAERLVPLARAFFERPLLVVAADLVGRRIVRRGPRGGLRVARIVEVEAYGGRDVDPSAHSFKGPTPRCATMFGPAGHAYVYATQGRCCCVNVTVEGGVSGRAVLLRAAEPEVGVGVMRRRRLARLADGPTRRALLSGADHELARGPGRLCLCLDVDTSLDGVDLTDGSAPLGLADIAGEVSRPALLWTGRIGLNPASASHDWLWRVVDREARSVSPDRALRAAASARAVPSHPPRRGRETGRA